MEQELFEWLQLLCTAELRTRDAVVLLKHSAKRIRYDRGRERVCEIALSALRKDKQGVHNLLGILVAVVEESCRSFE